MRDMYRIVTVHTLLVDIVHYICRRTAWLPKHMQWTTLLPTVNMKLHTYVRSKRSSALHCVKQLCRVRHKWQLHSKHHAMHTPESFSKRRIAGVLPSKGDAAYICCGVLQR